MLKEERQNFILNEVRAHSRVLSSELSLQLNVSEDTIRRDLKELSDTGHLRKVHGGAMSTSLNPYHFKDREIYAHEDKVLVAKKATPLFEDGQVIIMDGGTTNLELARIFHPNLKATIFTNSIPIATQLTEHPHINIIFIGGKLLKQAQVTIGMEVIQSLQRLKADICVLGTRSIDLKAGISEIDWEEAQVKRAAMAAANQVVSLAISEKLNTVQPYIVGDINAVHTLVTELNPDDNRLQPYHKAGLDIL